MSLKRYLSMIVLIVTLIMIFLPTGAFAAVNEPYSQNELVLEVGQTVDIKVSLYNSKEPLTYYSLDSYILCVTQDGQLKGVKEGRTAFRIATPKKVVEECVVTVVESKDSPGANTRMVEEPETEEIVHYQFCQSDPKWRFSEENREKGCVLTSMAMLLKNSGIDTDPRKTLRANGIRGMSYVRALTYYDKAYSIAVPYDAEYLEHYDPTLGRTWILDPEENFQEAIRDALEMHPEGVLCYFVKGGRKHAQVAIEINDQGVIYFNDSARMGEKGTHLTWNKTWCGAHHKMDYGDLLFFMAIN